MIELDRPIPPPVAAGGAPPRVGYGCAAPATNRTSQSSTSATRPPLPPIVTSGAASENGRGTGRARTAEARAPSAPSSDPTIRPRRAPVRVAELGRSTRGHHRNRVFAPSATARRISRLKGGTREPWHQHWRHPGHHRCRGRAVLEHRPRHHHCAGWIDRVWRLRPRPLVLTRRTTFNITRVA